MKEYIKVIDHEKYSVVKIFLTEQGVVIGEAIIDVDGSYYFWFANKTEGAWSSYLLREIADKLDELNKEYEDSLREYFKKDTNGKT